MSSPLASHTDIIILGAGPAGLACALKCQQLGREYLLIEGSNRIGGRLGSLYEDGYIFDLGFQVYNSAYVNTNRLLDLDELNLKYFKPGAAVHYGNSFQIVSDPLRDISKVFSTIFSNITTVSDKLKILSLKNSLSNYNIEEDKTDDITTLRFLKQYGFSEKMIDNFFIPFFSGIFHEKTLDTSSKFFKYVFSNFNNGLASLPEKGMQVIPEQLMSKIDIERVMMEKTAINLDDGNKVIFDDGDIIKGENIILTGESTTLAEKIKYEYNEVNTIYFTTENEIENGDYIHLFPEDDLINNIAIPSSISSAYSNGHSHLISITILEYDCSDIELIKKIRKRLSNYYGGEPGSYDFLRTFSISKATIKQPVGHFERKKIVKNGLIIAGEQATNGSIEGAIISGLNAADQL